MVSLQRSNASQCWNSPVSFYCGAVGPPCGFRSLGSCNKMWILNLSCLTANIDDVNSEESVVCLLKASGRMHHHKSWTWSLTTVKRELNMYNCCSLSWQSIKPLGPMLITMLSLLSFQQSLAAIANCFSHCTEHLQCVLQLQFQINSPQTMEYCNYILSSAALAWLMLCAANKYLSLFHMSGIQNVLKHHTALIKSPMWKPWH